MANSPDVLELSDYLAAAKRRRRLLLTVSLPVVGLAVALAIGLPDIFVSTGLITFTNATIPGELAIGQSPHGRSYDDLYILGLTGAVLSPPVLQQLLTEIPPLVKPGETREDAILDIADRTRVKPVRMPILDPDNGHTRDVISAFAISFDSRDPVEAERVATWLTHAFIGGNRVGLQSRVQAARQFYNIAAERYGRRINELESRLAAFKARHFNELPELTKLNLGLVDRTQHDLDEVTRRLRSSEEDRVFLEAELARARVSSLDTGLLGTLQNEYNRNAARYDKNHPDMLGLRQQIDALRGSGQSVDALSVAAQLQQLRLLLAQVRQRYSENHPDVQRIQRQIAALTAQLSRDPAAPQRPRETPTSDPAIVRLTTQLQALDAQRTQLQARETRLREQLDDLEKRMDESPLLEHEYKSLLQDLQAAHARYDELSQDTMALRVTAAAIASGHSDELRLVQAPGLPESPAKPRRLLIAAMGLAAAAIVGLTTLVLVEGFDPTIRCRRDVYRLLNAWPLVAIPEIFDPRRARRRRWQAATFAAGIALISAAAVITGRIFYR